MGGEERKRQAERKRLSMYKWDNIRKRKLFIDLSFVE